jgi:hypothetical protein
MKKSVKLGFEESKGPLSPLRLPGLPGKGSKTKNSSGYGGSFVTSMNNDFGSLGSRFSNEDFLEVFPPSSAKPKTPLPEIGIDKSVLFQMSYQNSFASRTIQRHWRGWYARYHMWTWGGIMLTSRAIKIQRVWRGRKGRKISLAKVKQRLANVANKIKGQYFIWLAKRKLRVLQAEQIEQRVTMIQCLYRTRLARFAVANARFIYHTRMATRIQSIARGRLGRRRYLGMKHRLRAVFERMSKTMVNDVKLSQARIKPSMESLVGNTNRDNKWQMLETVLFHIIGTIRRDVAVDLASELVLKHPDFAFGRFVLQIALFFTFTCSGPTNHVRMDMLDELVGCLYYGQDVFDQEADFNNFDVSYRNKSPESELFDPTSSFGWEDKFSGAMDELEFMYFRNAFLRHGKSAHSMTVMAACVLMRARISDWGTKRTKDQMRQIVRAKNLLNYASSINTNNMEETMYRMEITENIFLRAHRVLRKQTIAFDGLKMLGYKAFKLLHDSHKRNLKDSLELNIEVIRCGEVVIVRGTLNKMPMSIKAVQKARKFNNIKALQVDEETGEGKGIDMAPKWTIYTEDYEERVRNFKIQKVMEESIALDEEDEGIEPDFMDAANHATIGQLSHMGSSESIGDDSVGEMSVGSHGTGHDDEDDNHDDKSRKRRKQETEELHPYLPPLVIRPFVLTQRECGDIGNIAIARQALNRGIPEDEVRSEGLYQILSEYLLTQVRVATYRSKLAINSDLAEMASLKITLPQLEYRRLEQNNARTVEFSIKLIQRIYRGSRGKHRFRRIWFRARESDRQKRDLEVKRAKAKEVRDLRYLLVSKIQSSVKAWSWRRLMRKMKANATIIQCMVRCWRSRNIVNEERRRKNMGPEVIEMLRKTVQIGDIEFILIVYRCGNQYRLLGHNILRNEIYDGNVFQDEVEKMCSEHNSQIVGTNAAAERLRINPRSYHKVTEELILKNLGLAQALPIATTQLGGIPTESSQKKRYILVMKPYAKIDVPGITSIKNLRRVLKDTAKVVEKYEKMLAKEAKQRAQGIAVKSDKKEGGGLKPLGM